MNCKFCNRDTKDKQRSGRTRCNSCNTKIRRLRNKLKAIDLLGGKCIRCNYNNPAGLQFHHLNSDEKSFNIGSVANKSWNVLVKELKKCELLCANCHAETHCSKFDQKYLDEL